MGRIFDKTEILVPKTEDLFSWSVIACDQFTSQPEYWQAVKKICDGHFSALDLIIPEAWLADTGAERAQEIQDNMRKALREERFAVCPDAYIYVERTLHDGRVRKGLLGCVDLEQYSYEDQADTPVRATEKTVTERIPPRQAVRENAVLELPHILLLMDDDTVDVIGEIGKDKDRMPLLYDTELMMNGGRICGWLVQGEEAAKADALLDAYTQKQKEKFADGEPLIYVSGDGNHSLAAAKACCEAEKARDPRSGEEGSPGRYALAELENLHDPVQEFEAIHRVLFDTDGEELLEALKEVCAEDGYPVTLIFEGQEKTVYLDRKRGDCALKILQPLLDAWTDSHPSVIDYIHGADALRQLCRKEKTAGILLEPVSREGFFRTIAASGVFPRKTFSIGEAEDKRYYIEARRIKRL